MASTTIQISVELRDFLTGQAIKKGETYDQIIKRLLKTAWDVDISIKSIQTSPSS